MSSPAIVLALAAALSAVVHDEYGSSVSSSASLHAIDVMLEQGARLDDYVLTVVVVGRDVWDADPEDLALVREVSGQFDVVLRLCSLPRSSDVREWEPYFAALRGATLKRVELEDDEIPGSIKGVGSLCCSRAEAQLGALRRSVVRGAPFAEVSWQQRTAKRLGLQSTLRPRARPWKSPPAKRTRPYNHKQRLPTPLLPCFR